MRTEDDWFYSVNQTNITSEIVGVLTGFLGYHSLDRNPMTSKDESFDAMANSQRRQLLVELLVDGPQPIPYLSSVSRDLLQAHPAVLQEYLSGSEEVTSANKADIRAYHIHLPKLAEYDYIEWHQDAHLVTRGANFDDVRPLLESLDDQRDGDSVRDASLSIQK